MAKEDVYVTIYDYKWRCIKSDDLDIIRVGEVITSVDIIEIVNDLNFAYEDSAKFTISHLEKNGQFACLNIESYMFENGNNEISFAFEFVPTKSLITNCINTIQNFLKK